MKIKRQQFNNPEVFNQANIHLATNSLEQKVPVNSQCADKMKDLRLNTELARLRVYKKVAEKTQWYSELIGRILAANIQEAPLVLYFLDSIKNVIETGKVFSRAHLAKLQSTCDDIDKQSKEYQL